LSDQLSAGAYEFSVTLTDEETGLLDVAHAWTCQLTSDPLSIRECVTEIEIEPGHVIEAFVHDNNETLRLWLRAYKGPTLMREWSGHESVRVQISRDATMLVDETFEPEYETVSVTECATCASRELSIDLAATDT
jgi:hypothetical protein